MWTQLFGLEGKRRRLQQQAPNGPLKDFLAYPCPDDSAEVHDLAALALDLETTHGGHRAGEIVSFGWVCVDGPRIDLSTARHRVVRVTSGIDDASAVIHGITDERSAAGVALDTVLAELLAVLAGRVLIAHHAATEIDFLGAACRQVYATDITITAIDTLQLAAASPGRQGEVARSGAMRLGALRQRYGLPRYPVHNALSDALSAAELYLALLAERQRPLTLKSVRYRR